MELSLEHYRQIDIIRTAEQNVYNCTGIKPFNISHWNSGKEYKNHLLQSLVLPKQGNSFDYIYSYNFNEIIKEEIIKKHSIDNSRCSLFSNATSAIATICTALKAQGVKNVCLLCPSYFSVLEFLSILGLSFKLINYQYYNDQFHIPFNLIDSGFDMIWITDPVFSTGTYLIDSELKKLFELPQYIVVDGSMYSVANNKYSFGIDCKKKVFIYSPQKVIGMNDLKFCYVLSDSSINNQLEDWGDVVVGGLPATSIVAIHHFLSSNYSHCLSIHNDYVKSSHMKTDRIIETTNGLIKQCGYSTDNTYESLSVNNIPYTSRITYDSIYNFIYNTLVSITPGCVNGFDRQSGFCFRINHTLDIQANCTALRRIISYLGNL